MVVVRAEGVTDTGLTARDLARQGATFNQIYNEPRVSWPVIALFSPDGRLLNSDAEAENAIGYALDCNGCQDYLIEDGARLLGFLPASGEYYILAKMPFRSSLTPRWYRISYHSLPVRDLDVGRTTENRLDEDGVLDSADDYDVWQVGSDSEAEVVVESDDPNVIAIAEPRHAYTVAGGGLERSPARQVGRILAVAPRSAEGGGRRIVVAKNELHGGSLGYTVSARPPQTIEGVLDVRSLTAGELGAPQISAGVWAFEGGAGQVFGIVGRDTGWPEKPIAIFSPQGEQLLGGQSVAFFEMVTSYSVRLPQAGQYMLRFEPLSKSAQLWAWTSRVEEELTIGTSALATFSGGRTQRHWRLNCELGQMLVPRLSTEARDGEYGWFEEAGVVWEFELYSDRSRPGESGKKFLFCGDGEHWARVTLRDDIEQAVSGGVLEEEVVREVVFDAVEAMSLAMGETVCRGYRECEDDRPGRRFGDLWRFSGDGGQLVELRLDGRVPLELYYGRTGERLSSAPRRGLVRLSLPYSGWYYVWVVNSGSLDSYRLRAELVGPTRATTRG